MNSLAYTTDQEVDNDEVLHRGIPLHPHLLKDGKPTSAVFKDRAGLSVDVCAGRTDSAIKEQLLIVNPEFAGELRVSAALCKEKRCAVVHDPVNGNDFHALILGEEGRSKPQLTNSQAKALSRACEYISYDP